MENEYKLHQAIFADRIQLLSDLLNNNPRLVTEKDKHGNTPLHLAVMLGRSECIDLLLKHNAPIKAKNILGWPVMAEAISYANRDIIKKLLVKRNNQILENEISNRQKIIKTMQKVPDFEIDIHWDFRTWIPLASRLLPSDTCHIAKFGTKIRLDSTLLDFNNMKWERGNSSYIFDCSADSDHCMLIIDHINCVYTYSPVIDATNLDEEINSLMSTQISQMDISTAHVTVSRAQTGWFIKEDKTELIADQYNCDFYTIGGIEIHSTKRIEHLSPEDLRKNKEDFDAMLQSMKNGDELNFKPSMRPSLPPPPQPTVTWYDYISAFPGRYPCLNRPIITKTKIKDINLTIALSNEFPLTLETVIELLEMVTPLKRFKKLRDFIRLKLPNTDGFPVRLEVPVLPAVTAQVTFCHFQWTECPNSSKFEIPASYVQDATGFSNWFSD